VGVGLDEGSNRAFNGLRVGIDDSPQRLGERGKEVKRGQRRKQERRTRVRLGEGLENTAKPSNRGPERFEVFGVVGSHRNQHNIGGLPNGIG
jgi:hypothetical protein